MKKLLKLAPLLSLPSIFIGLGTVAAIGHERSVRVNACPTESRSTPITSACVAAAIAEEAFLKATQHKISRYMIFLHEGPSGQRWSLVIEEGDESHPGPDGSHWFVHVDRSSGMAEVVAGR
jgi:hypothetical protein